jgi:hypothetical protein
MLLVYVTDRSSSVTGTWILDVNVDSVYNEKCFDDSYTLQCFDNSPGRYW